MRKSKRQKLCKMRRDARRYAELARKLDVITNLAFRVLDNLGRVGVRQHAPFSAEKTRVQISHSL